jgi:hypothetical protein
MKKYLLIRRAKELILKSPFWHLLHLRMHMLKPQPQPQLQRHPIQQILIPIFRMKEHLVWLICLIRKP